MRAKASLPAGCVALLTLCVACSGGENAERAKGSAATPDMSGLRTIYGQIDSTYDSLMARYGAVSSRLPAEQRRLYESMQQMHAQASGVHGMMMGGGLMGGGGMMGGSGMMGGGGTGAMGLGAVHEWDQQMLAMHQAMATMFQQAGEQDMADLHQRMARLYGEALEYTSPPAGAGSPAETAAPQPSERAAGLDVFAQNCAACHGPDGRGVTGVFPPLASSPWVTGDADTPIRIVLHGLEGRIQIQNQDFNGVMPPFGARLTDQELAAVLSYVRSAFDNGAPAVDPESVAAVRRADAARTTTMTPDELR